MKRSISPAVNEREFASHLEMSLSSFCSCCYIADFACICGSHEDETFPIESVNFNASFRRANKSTRKKIGKLLGL